MPSRRLASGPSITLAELPAGTVIDGAWESSGNGEVWEHDFAVRYQNAG